MKSGIHIKTLIFLTLGSVSAFGTYGGGSSYGQFTMTSPTSEGALPSGISTIGGVVFDIVGLNGNRVVAQTAASDLFVGFYDTGTPVSYRGNPGTIGIQEGFNAGVWGSLGGGISEIAVRITVFDGDSSYNNFDYYDNDLLLNGINFGDFSSVPTVKTSSTGTVYNSPSYGFKNEYLNTGFFYSNDSGQLASLYSSLISEESIAVQLIDEDPYDNYFDFTQGLDSSLINVGSSPILAPAVPEPSVVGILGFACVLGLIAVRRNRRKR